MKGLLKQDKKRRRFFLKKEKIRLLIKYLCYNRFLPLRVRWRFSLDFSNLLVQSSVTRIKNRCLKTFSSRSILRNFRRSRITFRKLASFGNLFGVVKESW